MYHVEQPVEQGRVEAFLRTFAKILEHTHYGPLLETYARATTRCTRCACTCQIYQVTKDPHDIPVLPVRTPAASLSDVLHRRRLVEGPGDGPRLL